MKNIFITGSEGFIGSHLVETLIKSNKYKVKALVLYNHRNDIGWLSNINQKLLKEVEIIHGDIRDYDFLKSHTKNTDIIINLAALIGIPYSYDAPKSYIDTNIIGTHNILQCGLTNNIEKLIQTSTSEVFGNVKFSTGFDENSYQYAQSPYAATKIASDQMSNAFYSTYNLPVTIIRPFNTYGPRQSERAIIPTVINQILNNSKKIKLGNLYAFRDLNYIEDTISAFLKIITSKKNIAGEIFNIGSGYNVSMKDLVFKIKELMNSKIDIVFDYKRVRPKKSEVANLLCNNSKAKKVLKWKPKYSGSLGLELGLKNTIEWFKENSENYKNQNTYIK